MNSIFMSIASSQSMSHSTPQSQTPNNNETYRLTFDTIKHKSSTQLLADIYKIIDSVPDQKPQQSEKRTQLTEGEQQNHNWKCKCKKTKCLKLYCECFALGQLCKNCNCTDCKNTEEFEEQRAQAIDEALNRDPNSFHSKVKQLKGGCICKKTGCLKKYCECYNSGKLCTSDCKCLNCGNMTSMQEE